MSGYLRLTVASPRRQHVDSKGHRIDLAYIEPNLIVTSMPTSKFVKSWYRTPASVLRSYLDEAHGENWHLYNFRAENSNDYKDSIFNQRVTKFPFPDHQPPPFELIPKVVETIHEYLQQNQDNVAVLHCKAGQGRSGTMACAYLMAYENLSWLEAIDLFTKKRMRPWWGAGVSILSQRRYLMYTEKWIRQYDRQYNLSNFKGVKLLAVKLHGAKRRHIDVSFHQYEDLGATCRKILTLGASGSVESCTKLPLSTSHEPDFICYDPDTATVLPYPDIGVSFSVSYPTVYPLMQNYVQLWFNVLFELEPGQTQGTFSAEWSELDGFLGNSLVRGPRAFQKVEFQFRLLT